MLKPGELTVTLPVVKRQDLSVSAGGDFGVQIELFYKKPGRYKDDIYDCPDSLLYFLVPAGSGKYQQVTQTFVLPDNVACAFLRIGGTHFSGECWVEAPRLVQNKKQVCSIPFAKFADKTDDYNYWTGCNLSTRSWPRWKLDFNGTTVYEGNIFDRASDIADFYILLPASVQGNGDLKLTLLKEDNRAAYSYELRSLEIIEEAKHVYLFEQNESWLEAIRATFEPWKDKVTIVQKYVSNRNSPKEQKLDDFFRDKPDEHLFIKMDIEGAERRALAGCEQLFRDCKKIDFAICTYHLHDDEEVISAFLDKHNCTYRNQKGFFRHKIRSVVLRGNKKVN